MIIFQSPGNLKYNICYLQSLCDNEDIIKETFIHELLGVLEINFYSEL